MAVKQLLVIDHSLQLPWRILRCTGFIVLNLPLLL